MRNTLSRSIAESLPRMSTSDQRNRPAPLTFLAQRYGHPVGQTAGLSHRALRRTGKSGLTPLSPFHTTAKGSPHPSQDRKLRVHYYQQHRFFGFSAAELNRMGALAACQTMPMMSTLDNPIHPMFQRSQWDTEETLPKHLGFIPLYAGRNGHWQVTA
jgi:hypothetical protein